jgi:hypothetical protein
MGEALAAACAELAKNPCLEQADALLARLAGATEGVRVFRRRLLADIEARRDYD